MTNTSENAAPDDVCNVPESSERVSEYVMTTVLPVGTVAKSVGLSSKSRSPIIAERSDQGAGMLPPATCRAYVSGSSPLNRNDPSGCMLPMFSALMESIGVFGLSVRIHGASSATRIPCGDGAGVVGVADDVKTMRPESATPGASVSEIPGRSLPTTVTSVIAQRPPSPVGGRTMPEGSG